MTTSIFFLKITANIVCIVRLFLASGAVNCETTYRSLASGYVSQHVLIRFLSPEIGRVVARRASGVKKILGWHGWAYSHSRLRGCCRPASSHTVRGTSGSGPAISQRVRTSSSPELGVNKYKRSAGSFPRVLHVYFSSAGPRVLPSVRPYGYNVRPGTPRPHIISLGSQAGREG